MGDTNDHKYLGIHSEKPRKERGRCTSPEKKALLHQAADESFVLGQELSCAKEILCTTEDAQSAFAFEGQLGDVAFPGKMMAESEAQIFFMKGLLQEHCLESRWGWGFHPHGTFRET